MSELYEKSLHKLELDQVLERLSQCAGSAEGKAACLRLYPSSDLEEVWIDGKLLINNGGEVKRFSRHDNSVALAKGLHEIKAVFLGHIIGGWPSNWNDGSINLRKADADKFTKIDGKMLCH